MSVTIKQVIIGTVLGTTVVGLAIVRIHKERISNPQTTQVASLRKLPMHKKHGESELSTRKTLG